jgi:hypothetical protein
MEGRDGAQDRRVLGTAAMGCAISSALLLAVVLWSTRTAAAAGMDAGGVDGGGGCGAVTAQGMCNGNTLSYCDSALGLQMYDCTTHYTATTRCIQIDQTLGNRCAEATGQPCVHNNGGGSPVQTLYCQGANAGCLEMNQDNVSCAVNIGPCTQGQVGMCLDMYKLMTQCNENQPYLVDCGGYGGACASGHCMHIPLGGYCDNQLFICDQDLRCFSNACVPTALPNPDASVADASADASIVDASGSGGKTNSGCSCVTPNTRPNGALIVVATVFVFARRKRVR